MHSLHRGDGGSLLDDCVLRPTIQSLAEVTVEILLAAPGAVAVEAREG